MEIKLVKLGYSDIIKVRKRASLQNEKTFSKWFVIYGEDLIRRLTSHIGSFGRFRSFMSLRARGWSDLKGIRFAINLKTFLSEMERFTSLGGDSIELRRGGLQSTGSCSCRLEKLLCFNLKGLREV